MSSQHFVALAFIWRLSILLHRQLHASLAVDFLDSHAAKPPEFQCPQSYCLLQYLRQYLQTVADLLPAAFGHPDEGQ